MPGSGDLPPDWEEVPSGEGDFYFWNSKTDEVTWDRPVKKIPGPPPRKKPAGPPPRTAKPPAKTERPPPKAARPVLTAGMGGGGGSRPSPQGGPSPNGGDYMAKMMEMNKRKEARLAEERAAQEAQMKLGAPQAGANEAGAYKSPISYSRPDPADSKPLINYAARPKPAAPQSQYTPAPNPVFAPPPGPKNPEDPLEIWHDESKISSCEVCGDDFIPILRSKHHCRNCGRVVCGKCSNERLRLDHVYNGEKFVRVCDVCYTDSKNAPQYGVRQFSARMKGEEIQALKPVVSERAAKEAPAVPVRMGRAGSAQGAQAFESGAPTIPTKPKPGPKPGGGIKERMAAFGGGGGAVPPTVPGKPGKPTSKPGRPPAGGGGTYPLAVLQDTTLPDDVDPMNKEMSLHDDVFLSTFGMPKEIFKTLAPFMKDKLRGDVGLDADAEYASRKAAAEEQRAAEEAERVLAEEARRREADRKSVV